MLSDEQIEEIKEQIIHQIESWEVSDEHKEQAIGQVKSMNAKQLEEFLKQNEAIKNQNKGEDQCPFCLIVQGKIKSFKIAENKEAIAVLEINPLSKGHSIVIPKNHLPTEKIPFPVLELSKQIAEQIKNKLKPKEISISTSNIMGHSILNVIPSYGKETGERKKADEKQLSELQKKLKIEPKKPKDETPTGVPSDTKSEGKKSSKPKKLEKAPIRIP